MKPKIVNSVHSFRESLSAFYCLYSHLSGSLTTNRSFWLGWKI